MTISSQIKELKKELGSDLLIVAHHYQNDEVIEHADLRGDSLELARKAMQSDAQHIVFCGVHFMAESAALLAKDKQAIYMPAPNANCVMAQMSPASLVEKILAKLTKDGRKIIPLAYINTSLAIKAVVGRYQGSVCTSANASKMLTWALDQGDGVLFLPDKNLAQNTAHALKIDPKQLHILDIRQQAENMDLNAAKNASILCYPGLCAIHSKFRPEQINLLRKNDPKAEIIVHPECSPELVQLADACGSTSFLINYVEKAPSDAHIYIATEINLVQRLAKSSQKFIKPLHFSSCSDMAKVTAQKLLTTLENIKNKTASPVIIDKNDIPPAKQALETMLSL